MKIKEMSRQGFTVIECLVGIVLIVILAGLILPMFIRPTVSGVGSRPLMHAKQIGLACKLFAGDHDGHYPSNLLNAKGEVTATSPSSANAALGQLFPDYIPDKEIFWLAQDKVYCNSSAPKNKSPGLGAGENHWGYVINLTETSDSRFPLIADGAAFGGTDYSVNENAAGGTWKGKKAIVIYVDGSGSIELINKATLTIPCPSPEIPNILQAGQKNWLGATNLFLNPIPKAF
jgi:prepilin-type N-terminal cleavage/methylation domain-containing protein